jgi:DNA-binding NarL/FixJ family response regulator
MTIEKEQPKYSPLGNSNRYKVVNENRSDFSKICVINNSEIIRVGINSVLKEEYKNDIILDVSKKEFSLLWEQSKFDIIITDIEFDGKNDTSFIPTIKQSHPDAIIIVYTNFRNQTHRKSSLNDGAHFFIFVDKNLNLLEYIVRRIMNNISSKKK